MPRINPLRIKKNAAKRFLIASLSFFTLGCTNPTPYFVGNTTKNHPATKTFIHFVKATQHSNSIQDVIYFYSNKNHDIINKAMGWHKFTYTAVYKALKEGANCIQINTTLRGQTKAQIDCIGDYTFKPYYSSETQEDIHIRINMVKEKDKWYLLHSGYTHTQNNRMNREYNRVGIKFKSIFEKK